jgi:hypothetical protein
MLFRKLAVNWRYAFGEIAIVVIGVLIALTLNNWNESRRDGERERDYLDRLAADVRRDTTAFAFTDSLLNAKERGLAQADSVINGGQLLRDTAAFLQSIVSAANFSWSQTRVRTTTYLDLQSTGNLRLIRDATLRGKIVQYYEQAESEFNRIMTRRTGYGALTYELLPRKEEFILDVPDRNGLGVLTRRVMTPELGRLLTAERNFARFVRERNAVLRANSVQLLSDLSAAAR